MSYKILVDGVSYHFGNDGFLQKAIIPGFGGRQIEVAQGSLGRIEITLADGRILTPFVPQDAPPLRGKFDGAKTVEFPDIRWRDENATTIPPFRMALRYEFWDSGRAFVEAFWCSDTFTPPELARFSLNFQLATGQFASRRWSFLPRPLGLDGAAIQTPQGQRYLSESDSFEFEHQIIPQCAFELTDDCGESCHWEIFVEGQTSVNETALDNRTRFRWLPNRDFRAEYDFIRETPCKNQLIRLPQWRNRWGWVLKAADLVRHHPPFQMYHYLNTFQRNPTDECLRNIALSGANVLVIHEVWRLDVQNEGFAFDDAGLRLMIASAHQLGLRVCFYIRGNELSVREDACKWFDRYLKRNWDGLYMDYGGPTGYLAPANEFYPGGRMEFHVIFYPCAPCVAASEETDCFLPIPERLSQHWALSAVMVDGYVSGEGEDGIMISNREIHRYYSAASACCGTMWTAAFPAYSSSRMRPFLAATGQYPHVPLGTQFVSSSLAHPDDPGLNDRAFRPLWKLWRFFRHEKDIRIFNNYNGSGIFPCSKEIGFYLMVSSDQSRALLIMANFSKEPVEIHKTLNWPLTGFAPDDASVTYVLTPTEDAPLQDVPVLNPDDVAGIYYDHDRSRAEKLLEDFKLPYPELSESNRKHLARVARQRELRQQGGNYLRLTIPELALSFEYSLVYDLYCNTSQLVEFLPDGTEKLLGWIARQGFSPVEPPPQDYVWPTQTSAPIDLRKLVVNGRHQLAVKTLHYGKNFYNFGYVELSDTPDFRHARRLEFMNELEDRREFLRWTMP